MFTITLFPPLSKGKPILIHTRLFRNDQKCYPSRFDSRAQQINFFIQPLDVHVCSPSEKISCDSLHLWQSLPLHYPPTEWLQGFTEALCNFQPPWLLFYTIPPLSIWQGPYWNILPTFPQDIACWYQCKKIIIWICVTRNILSLRIISFKSPSICSLYHHKISI